ncbi:MAG: D-alanyl-D-alanine carboxypeptidase [Bacilli bacterium]|nr:D-alanyl-D-alanine carboxypeptidase [Bacilli bacterium]
MKKVLLIITLFLIAINVNAEELNISSKSAILYNQNDGKVLFAQNENEKVQIASITKIMTAIVSIEQIDDLDKKITLTSNDFKGIAEENLVTAGFAVGQTVTYRDLLYGLLVKSGAECAKGLVNNITTLDKFVELMNNKVRDLKLNQTSFSNPIGLDDENNYSTANEVSKIFMYALKNEEFKKIITTDSYTSSDGKLTINNKIRKNKDVGDYLLGGKTGTTDGAGLCLASIASKDDVNFLLITLGAPYDKKGPHNFEDAKTIYQYYIDNYGYHNIWEKDDVILSLKTKLLKKDKIDFYPQKVLKVYLPNSFDKKDLVYKYNGEKIIKFNMKKGQKLGKLDVYYKDEKIASQNIVLNEKPSLSILKVLDEYKLFIIIFVVSFLTLIFVKRKLK